MKFYLIDRIESLEPGKRNTWRCEVDVVSIDGETAKFKAVGHVGDKLAVSAKLELVCFNLADRPALKAPAESDAAIVAGLKDCFKLMGGPAALAADAS